MFQAPNDNEKLFDEKSLLLTEKIVQSYPLIELKNRLGRFVFKNANFDDNWEMISPRELLVKKEIMTSLVKSLSTIKIRRVLKKDPINMANYSLNEPLMEVMFKEPESDEKVSLKFGLIDSIGKSTYVMQSNKDVIYHVDQLEVDFLKLDLTDFIETRVFMAKRKDISSLIIFKDPKQNRIGLQLSEVEGKWRGRVKTDLNQAKVTEFLDNFLNIRSGVILDKYDEKTSKDIEKYFKRPLYRISLLKKDESEIIYDITPAVNRVGDLKIEKRKHFLVRSNLLPHTYVVPRKYLKVFSVTEKNISSIPLKKLFY